MEERVVQIDPDSLEAVRSWADVAEIETAMLVHRTAVENALAKHVRTAGFYWVYEDEYAKTGGRFVPAADTKTKPVTQIDAATFTILRTWPSRAAAARSIQGMKKVSASNAIIAAITDRTEFAGCFWAEAGTPLPSRDKFKRAVRHTTVPHRVLQLDPASGEPIRAWESMSSAARSVGLTSAAIKYAAKKGIESGGYLWVDQGAAALA